MLELINAKKIYTTKAGDVAALDDLNLILPSTGMVFVTGKSGSGKTTLLNVVGGLDDMDNGEIVIDGKRFSEFTQKEFDSYRNSFIGFIFQEYNLLPDYTVEKNIKIADELQGKKTDEKVLDAILEKVGILELKKRKPSELSGGQKQRVAIARALVKNPKIIMADEPTGALDSVTGKQVIEIMKELSKDKLVLVVSHDLELAEKYADRIIRLVDGKIVEDITLTDVEIVGNTYDGDRQLVIKSGADLNEGETLQLVKAIREKKEIKVQEKIKVRDRKKTVEKRENVEGKEVKLLKSKMKYRSAAYLGLKSLWVKPFRLIITIILSVVAFSVFGLFDTIAAYEDNRIIANLLRNSDYNAVAVNPVYKYSEKGLSYRYSSKGISNLSKETGYDFRGVYDVYGIYNYTNESYTNLMRVSKGENLVRIDGQMQSADKYTSFYYRPYISGLIEFDESEINSKGIIDKGGFNYKILYGEYPKLERKEGALTEDSFKNIGISKFVAQSILYTYDNTVGDVAVEKLEDVIGKTITVGSKQYVIKAIIDCGSIPSKYNSLKTEFNEETKVLEKDLDTYLHSSAQLYFFAPKGYVQGLREFYGYSNKYYSNSYNNYVFNAYSYNGISDFTLSSGDATNKVATFYNFDEFNHGKEGIYGQDNLIDFKNITLTSKDSSGKVLSPNYTTPNAENDNTYGVYVNLLDFNYIYENEINVLKLRYSTKIKKILDVLENRESSMSDLRNAVLDFSNLIDEYNKTVSSEKYFKIDKKASITKLKSYDVENDMINLKIDGFYVNVNSKALERNIIQPLMVSSKALKELDVYTEQGEYSRAIAPLNANYFAANKLASKITSDGAHASQWYGNSVLSVIQENDVIVKKVSTLVLYIAIILAVFSIFMLFNYISTSIISKRQSIGVLRALGSGGKDIFKMFITESLIISIINGLFSILITYIACGFVNQYIRNVMYITLDLAIFDVRQIIIIMATSLITGILSSLIPILKIAKEKPVKLIREP